MPICTIEVISTESKLFLVQKLANFTPVEMNRNIMILFFYSKLDYQIKLLLLQLVSFCICYILRVLWTCPHPYKLPRPASRQRSSRSSGPGPLLPHRQGTPRRPRLRRRRSDPGRLVPPKIHKRSLMLRSRRRPRRAKERRNGRAKKHDTLRSTSPRPRSCRCLSSCELMRCYGTENIMIGIRANMWETTCGPRLQPPSTFQMWQVSTKIFTSL